MLTFRRALAITSMVLIVGVFLAACGGQTAATTSTNTTGANNQTMTPATPATQMKTPTTQATMAAQATPTATSAMTGDNGNMNAFIHTAFVMISGKKVHVLTNNKGFMLYYYQKDTMLTSSCTGACAQNWPPVLQPQGMMTVTSSIALPHKLSVHKTGNGNQVFYDGHPLYTYAADMQMGQFSGRGMDNAWYLVGVNL
ncbi:MAG TPA: hypothetical protein VGD98_03810 [Ktedonobacteraceae bacterium]